MRFILVQCHGRDDRFPDHVQWRANGPLVDVFFWLRREDGEIGAKEYLRKYYPMATFSDEKVH